MDKYLILICIIISAGTFGGLVRFFNAIDTAKQINLKELIKYILTGIGAAILIPLFLNMISSDLIKADKIEILNYFIFTGFCFIAAYLSDKFLTTIGDKILNEVNKVKRRQERTTQTVDLLIDNETDAIDSSASDNPNQMDNVFQRLNKNIEEKDTGLISEILKAFDRNGKYTFRSIKGISKELNYPESTVGIMFKAFEDNGLIKKVRKKDDGQFLWGITSLGKFMKTYKK